MPSASSVQIVTLDRAADAAALEDYTSSYNMRGVTVELTVVVRPATLVRTVTASLPTDAQLLAALLRVRRWAGRHVMSFVPLHVVFHQLDLSTPPSEKHFPALEKTSYLINIVLLA